METTALTALDKYIIPFMYGVIVAEWEYNKDPKPLPSRASIASMYMKGEFPEKLLKQYRKCAEDCMEMKLSLKATEALATRYIHELHVAEDTLKATNRAAQTH